LIIALFPTLCNAQYVTKYPDIPRIDTHIHFKDTVLDRLPNYLNLRDTVMQRCRADIAMWVNLEQRDPSAVLKGTGGRMLSAFSTFRPAQVSIEHYKEKDIQNLYKQGYIGYKLWYAPYSRQGKQPVKYKYIDDPAHDKAFAELERQGVLLTSLHIADPNGPFEWRTRWANDPVDYWRQIIGLERVLSRHPKLKVVMAHGAWLMTQDAQLDYLRYLLETYPNMNIDLSATLQYCNLQSYDNLRDFILAYQDRITWGYDFTSVPDNGNYDYMANSLINWFRFLETADVFGESISNNKKPLKGLALPKSVLEKIYYKNALRIYPSVLKESMEKLGYKVD
jgi:hypothetical protein